MMELYSAVASFAIVPQSLLFDHVTMYMWLTSIQIVTIDHVVTRQAIESYHDAPNPWIPPVIRIDRPAPRDDHCAGPHLVGCRAHVGLREVALRDGGCAIGGAHRLGGCRSVSRRGKYVFRSRRHRGADGIVRFAAPARCRRHCPVAIGKHRKAGLRDPAALARGGSGLPRRGWHFSRALG